MPFLNRIIPKTQRAHPILVDMLVIGPGGSGGQGGYGGAGGAGGVYYKQRVSVQRGATYTIIVPGGGSNTNTSITGTGVSITGLYGGEGGAYRQNGKNGGSAGGGGFANYFTDTGGGTALQPGKSQTPMQDNATGGYGNDGAGGSYYNIVKIGPGGGAGSYPRGYGVSGVGGYMIGGEGLYFDDYSMFGENGYFAGGGNSYFNGGGSNDVYEVIAPSPGGGGGTVSNVPGTRNGKSNTGGGGAGSYGASASTEGIGGSGIVLLSYPSYYKYATSITGSPIRTLRNRKIVYAFTGSGTIVF